MCIPTESLELSGKSNQFENWRFMYLRETKIWWCEGEGEEGGEEGEEKVHLLTHGSTFGDHGLKLDNGDVNGYTPHWFSSRCSDFNPYCRNNTVHIFIHDIDWHVISDKHDNSSYFLHLCCPWQYYIIARYIPLVVQQFILNLFIYFYQYRLINQTSIFHTSG